MGRANSVDLIASPGGALRGSIALPGDKSLAHRAALLAAMACGDSQVGNFPVSGVTQAMLDCLTELGVAWQLKGNQLQVSGTGLAGLKPPARPLNCGNSATTLRLLAGALAASGVAAVLDGTPGLRRRPMGRIVTPLQMMGVDIRATDGCAPLVMSPSPRPLKPLEYHLTQANAQVKSCLLLAALAANGCTTLYEPGPSRDHTERFLRSLGISVISQILTGGEHPEYLTQIDAPASLNLSPVSLDLPGDISSAAFLIVGALISPGSDITIYHVLLNPTRTGLLDALVEMGADIQIGQTGEQGGEPVGDLQVRHSYLHGIRVSGPLVVRMIDEFPAFAVAAVNADGETVVSQAEELRHKESDRIGALCNELGALGADIGETQDGFTIMGGGALRGGIVDAHGDHRLAMALAVAGLLANQQVTVHGAQAIQESFPDFCQVFGRLGAEMTLQEGR